MTAAMQAGSETGAPGCQGGQGETDVGWKGSGRLSGAAGDRLSFQAVHIGFDALHVQVWPRRIGILEEFVQAAEVVAQLELDEFIPERRSFLHQVRRAGKPSDEMSAVPGITS